MGTEKGEGQGRGAGVRIPVEPPVPAVDPFGKGTVGVGGISLESPPIRDLTRGKPFTGQMPRGTKFR